MTYANSSDGDNYGVAEYLIARGAEVSGLDLFVAIKDAKFDVAEQIASRGAKVDPNSLAYYACCLGQIWKPQAVDMLLASGADINMNYSDDNGHNYTALGYAVLYRELDMVIYLVDNGADVNLHLASSTSPLQLAKVSYRRYLDKCPGCPGVHYYDDVPPSPRSQRS